MWTIWFLTFSFCQAQSQPQHSWWVKAQYHYWTNPTQTDQDRAGIVPRCSSRLDFATFKVTRGFLRSSLFTKRNHSFQTEPNLANWTKPSKLNQIYQTKLTKPNLPNQPFYTKLLVKVVSAWVRSAFGNVYICICIFAICYLICGRNI